MKKTIKLLSLLLCLLLLAACGTPAAQNSTSLPTAAPTTSAPKPEGIQNIILIIGDGMGDAQIRAGELAKGEPFCFHDWAHIHSNTDSLTTASKPETPTDSAAGGTALATGQLTTNGKVAQLPDSNEDMKTILDYATEYGKTTGVMTTDTLYGATPASFSGHASDRSETHTILLKQAISGIDLLCSDFDDETAALRSQFESAGYTYCDFISKIDSTKADSKVCWQFDMAGTSATAKLEKVVPHALEYLSQGSNGFVLIIEQAHIDKYSHSNEIEGTQLCANSLNNTVQAVLDWCKGRDDTAILITADHETGGLSVSEQDEFDNRYVSGSGNAFYYQYTTTGHSKTPVSVYAYGFTPDFSPYYLEGNTDMIKNTAVFDIMLSLLENPTQ